MAEKESNQIAILRFVYEKQLEKGYPPTVRKSASVGYRHHQRCIVTGRNGRDF